MKKRALKISVLFLFVSYIIAPPDNSTDIFKRPGNRPYFNCSDAAEKLEALTEKVETLSQALTDLPSQLNAGVRGLADTVTRDVLDQVAYYYLGTGLTGGAGLGLFLYGVTRKDAGLNKKTFVFVGTSGVLITLATMMATRPDLFGNQGHGH